MLVDPLACGEDNEGIGSAETEKAMEWVRVSLFILPR